MSEDDTGPDEPIGASITDAIRGGGDQDYKPASYTAVDVEGPPEPPAVVAKYLMDSEIRAGVIAVRQHWAVLIPPAAGAVGGLAAAIAVNGWLYETHRASAFPVRSIWIAYLCVVLWAGARYASWRVWWFVVTGGRLMTVGGLLVRRVTPLPLKRVRDLELIQPGLGQILGYGTIECESIATDHALHTIDFLPFTVELWGTIWSRLLPAEARGVRFEGMQEDAW